MRISRRRFVVAVPAMGLALSAKPRERIVERRTYGAQSLLPSCELLRRNGIGEVEIQRATLGFEYVLRFQSLDARVRAWDRVNTDPEWCTLRERQPIELLALSLAADFRR